MLDSKFLVTNPIPQVALTSTATATEMKSRKSQEGGDFCFTVRGLTATATAIRGTTNPLNLGETDFSKNQTFVKTAFLGSGAVQNSLLCLTNSKSTFIFGARATE